MNTNFAFGLTTIFALAALAPAQSLTVPQNINAGEVITIVYDNPGRAGQTVPITIAVSNPGITTIEVPVVLDSRGRGSITYLVPDALSVMFNAPECRQVTRFP